MSLSIPIRRHGPNRGDILLGVTLAGVVLGLAFHYVPKIIDQNVACSRLERVSYFADHVYTPSDNKLDSAKFTFHGPVGETMYRQGNDLYHWGFCPK
jgi:hypothetical protein